jgi:hypothetical protein
MTAPISRSGFATRSIGRFISEASPTSVDVEGLAASSPMKRRIAVPALPMSSGCETPRKPRKPLPRAR